MANMLVIFKLSKILQQGDQKISICQRLYMNTKKTKTHKFQYVSSKQNHIVGTNGPFFRTTDF